jgi:exopolyphosphatase/guanosine-5'-triphosphate,3'-diphosphate pyrophosphatase
MCALGKGLARTGRLNPEGVKSAKVTMARFMIMAERLELASLDILATAAVRDAEDGKKFVAELQKEFGIEVKIISGEREAELAAKGVIASVHEPLGISADLGGGSMELASVERSRIGLKTTCPLGSLRILDGSEGKVKVMEEIIKRELKAIPWLKNAHPNCLYGIGGGFRTLAKLHMRKTNYPLNIVHEYTMSRRAISQLIEKLISMNAEEISKLPGVSQKRAPTMIPTALVLQQLLDITGAPEIMFSVSGIREGFFYDLLSPKLQQEDSLTASAIDLAALIGRGGKYAQELYDWTQPLFLNEPIGWRRLRFALCTLSELAWSIDPNFRAEWAYNRIIQSSLKGLDHKERIMLALALYHRYQTKWRKEKDEMKLLDDRERLWARCVGLSANLAFQLSGGKAGNLHHADIQIADGRIHLGLDKEASPLRTEMVEKRLDGLGEALKAFSNFVI